MSHYLNKEKVLELIKSFGFSFEFFSWLVNEGCNNKILVRRLENNIYETLGEYYIHNTRFFSFGGKCDVNNFESFCAKLESEDNDLVAYFEANIDRVEKKITSETITENHYTILSHSFYKGQVCGSWWEVYELPELMHSLEGSQRVRERIEAVCCI